MGSYSFTGPFRQLDNRTTLGRGDLYTMPLPRLSFPIFSPSPNSVGIIYPNTWIQLTKQNQPCNFGANASFYVLSVFATSITAKWTKCRRYHQVWSWDQYGSSKVLFPLNLHTINLSQFLIMRICSLSVSPASENRSCERYKAFPPSIPPEDSVLVTVHYGDLRL